MTGRAVPLLAFSRRGLFLTGGGGFLLAGLAWVWGRPDLALGFLLGTLASILNFAGLEKLSKAILTGNLGGSLGFFWFFNLFRLGFLVFTCWFFWRISPDCFLGGAFSYLWCLGVLLALALRARHFPEIS